jgi:hypothetical protein
MQPGAAAAYDENLEFGHGSCWRPSAKGTWFPSWEETSTSVDGLSKMVFPSAGSRNAIQLPAQHL